MPPKQPVKLVLVLSENWTLVSPRDLRALVRISVEAEEAGIDAVMLSEHVVMGPSSGSEGIMGNPRDYAAPGNQDPATPWPDSIVLASAIAAATSTIRIALAAVIAPLRHPLLLAKQLATLDLLAEGRLVVQPTVSWHEEEYEALGVPFHERGAILDEQLVAMERAWQESPASFEGSHFSFHDVYVEPKPFRPGGPRMWFGGMSLHDALLRRIVRYGHGFHPFGTPTPEELERLRVAMAAAGRDSADLEMIGGIRGRFPDATSTADVREAFASVPAQLAAGYTSICFKPSMYTDDPAEVGALCRQLVAMAEAAV
jgi:probable F420-dependent oxidoreductase